MTNVACIYHANCPDGFAAAWAVRKSYPDAQMIPARYGDPTPDFEETPDLVFVVDFSWPYGELMELAKRCDELVVLDHHQSALDKFAAHPTFAVQPDTRTLVRTAWEIGFTLILDMDRSGAGITWDYLYDSARPHLLEYVEDGDLWRFTAPGSRRVRSLIKSLPHDFEVWDTYMAYTASQLAAEAGSAHMAIRRIVEAIAGSGLWATMGGMDGAAFRSERMVISSCHPILASDVCQEMMDRFSAPVAATFFEGTDGSFKYSIRSDGSVNVQTFAELFGGGGHRSAAGFTTPALAHVRRQGRGSLGAMEAAKVLWSPAGAIPTVLGEGEANG